MSCLDIDNIGISDTPQGNNYILLYPATYAPGITIAAIKRKQNKAYEIVLDAARSIK